MLRKPTACVGRCVARREWRRLGWEVNVVPLLPRAVDHGGNRRGAMSLSVNCGQFGVADGGHRHLNVDQAGTDLALGHYKV